MKSKDEIAASKLDSSRTNTFPSSLNSWEEIEGRRSETMESDSMKKTDDIFEEFPETKQWNLKLLQSPKPNHGSGLCQQNNLFTQKSSLNYWLTCRSNLSHIFAHLI